MQTAPKIFGGEIKTHLLAFFSGEDDTAEESLAGLKEVASDFKGKVSYTPNITLHSNNGTLTHRGGNKFLICQG